MAVIPADPVRLTPQPTPVRLTPQRQAVLDVLRCADDHPTAADVYERVRDTSPRIGAATVYRTLALLVGTGQAQELHLGGHASRYDANINRHDHMVCSGCHRAMDLEAGLTPALVAEAARSTGFTVTGYDLQFRGLCPTCAADGPD
jgi:Fe2+ or Zn2+ uptake regulation protein